MEDDLGNFCISWDGLRKREEKLSKTSAEAGLVFGAGHLRGSRLLSFLHSTMKNLVWGGGVGWGGIIMSFDTYVMQHICAFSCIHIHTYVMLRCRFSCASTRTSCYAAVDSLAFPHIRHARL